MGNYSLRDVQDHLSELIAEAQHGKTVLIVDENEGTVQLVPVTTICKAQGLIKLVADFDEYMD